MLSRYFSRLDLTPMTFLMVTFAVATPVHASALLDTNGEPLPDDFGALIQLLSESDKAKQQKVLGLSAEKAKPVADESTDKKEKIKKVSKDSSKKSDDAGQEEIEPKKVPAFQDVELAKKLYDALDVGDAQRVKWMLQSGAGNVYVAEDNDTSLRLAIRKGWASVVRVLLERGPDLEHELPGKVNLLHEASVKGAYDIAKMLVAAGMDSEVKTSKNWSNLHLSARYGHVDMVRYYLSLGLDPDDRNSEGNTAYWLASHARHYQAAGYLKSRTNASSYEIFGDGKGKKGKKKSNKGRKTVRKAPEFTPAQLQAILGN